MEFASYLAGERWSDHPRCTHPLLAAVARLVNDNTSDDGRQRLTGLIPSVIGLTSDDPRWNAVIARRAAVTALPVVSFEHQRALAVGLLTCERVLAELDGRPATSLSATRPAKRWRRCRRPSAGRGSTAVTDPSRPRDSIDAARRASSCSRSVASPRDAAPIATTYSSSLLTATIADCAALMTWRPSTVGFPSSRSLSRRWSIRRQ